MCNNVAIDTRPWGCREAVRTLARWKLEAVKTPTQKSYAETKHDTAHGRNMVIAAR